MRQGGVLFGFDPGGKVDEHDTFTCAHCQKVVIVKHKCSPDDLGGFCRMCMKPVCPKCASGPCDPFEKKLEREEHRHRMLREYGV